MIHTGDTLSNTGKIRFSHPLNVDDIAVDNPELRIIMCHLGNPWILDCQEVLYKNKNVYADISGLFIGDFASSSAETYYISKVRELLKYVGLPHRILYGTDWPICNMESYIKFVRKLDLDPQSFDLLMSSNAKSVFVL
jgi:predicted TIM-barrel fold metal-dependent hydrolase